MTKEVPREFAEAFAKAVIEHLCPKCGNEMEIWDNYHLDGMHDHSFRCKCGYEKKVGK